MERQAVRPIPIDKTYIKGLAKRLAKEFISRIDGLSPSPGRSTSWTYRPLSTYKTGLFDSKETLELGKVIRKTPHWKGTGWTDARGGDPIKIWFHFDKKKTKKGMYKFFRGAGWGQYGLEHQWLELRVDGGLSAGEIEGNLGEFEREIYSLLIHEITHAKELFYQLREEEGGYKEDPKIYYNDPLEVRAFMQQVADEVIERGGDFRASLRASKTWNKVKPHMTTQNKQKVIQGAWREYQDRDMAKSARKIAFKHLLATRPIPVPKNLIRRFSDLAYSDMIEMLTQYKPHPRFRDVELKSTPSAKDLERSSRVVRTLEVSPVALKKMGWTVDHVIKMPLRITFVSKEKRWFGRQFVNGGHVGSRAYMGDNRRRPFEMQVDVTLARSYDELTDPSNKPKIIKELFSVLIHEWTHARDWLPGRPNAEGYDEDPEVYYNEPFEVRAFMQQVADEVIDALKTGYNSGLSFDDALYKSDTWHRVKKHMNTGNRKIVLKGVWTAVLDAKKSGEIFVSLEVKGRYTPDQLIDLILKARKDGKLDPDSTYYNVTDNREKLKAQMIELAKTGDLWEELRWYGFGFNYVTADFLKTKIDRAFLEME